MTETHGMMWLAFFIALPIALPIIAVICYAIFWWVKDIVSTVKDKGLSKEEKSKKLTKKISIVIVVAVVFYFFGHIIAGILAIIVFILDGPGFAFSGIGRSVHSDSERDPVDSDMYACSDEWRRLHPYGHNLVTGGWNEEEDHTD